MILKCLSESFHKLIYPRIANNYWQLETIKQKDILTLEEASLYLNIQTGMLLEEVGLGKLPGGQLAGRWRFCKDALLNHFSIYHGNGPWIGEENVEEETEVCKGETISRVIEDYKAGRKDFSEIDLRGADFRDTDLSEADFSGSWLSRANFEGSILRGAEFQSTHLRESNFRGANLSYVNFQGADLTGADLGQAILVGANLSDAILLGIDLWGANIEDAKFR
ncbi:pentapeptide repeat-containing protein [aff. Roholtiella sp. LEGE 12411]|uniref:pentapeptide repeat-containing protein n=1 Tax=aff. Roholtiella sp. LEGE 12411 TaxID=1828822 RepID=UPI001882A01B|nr:pentapeptide repeat-containing protein [aff. Roholtiella sp. LEGE 12411]MBE9038251.1 pentapeptide repeat-containing protein [aff. Roholtiella sp. LEGE 12411]